MIEPCISVKLADKKSKLIPVKSTDIHKIDDLSVYISITDTSEYFYDHQNLLRKKLTVRFTNEIENKKFLQKYEIAKKEAQLYRYYSNGTLKSRHIDDRYEEYYNKPGYILKFSGTVDDNYNYNNGTFYNLRQNIQIDFNEIKDNMAMETYSIFFYDDEGDEVSYYEGKINSDMHIDVNFFDVDKFAEQNVPEYNENIIYSETVQELSYRILKEIKSLREEIKSLREEIKSLRETPKKSGWFY